MEFPDQIFKAYDIRGVYPNELNEELAYKVGRAFALFIKKEEAKDLITVAVSYDMRTSSEPLTNQLVKGITDEGVNVAKIGLLTTTAFYFAVGKYGYSGGIQVTASHNPKQYNGFKMVRSMAVPIAGETGMQEIKEMVAQGEFKQDDNKKGKVEIKAGILEEHVEFALSQVDTKTIKPFKIAVDVGNGTAGRMVEELFAKLPGELVKMYFEPDGNFPNHEANPFEEKNNKDLQARVVKVKADLGVAFDADGDRIFFIDERGRTIEPAIMRGILAQIFLREHPNSNVCYDVRPGKITIDMIKEAGGTPVVTRVGHSLIKAKMNQVGAYFGGESSGHFFLKTKYGTYETSLIMLLKFLVELSKSGKTASEFVKPLRRYVHSGEINFEVDNKQAVFDRLKEKYSDNFTTDIDGLSFEWADWWFNVRASNTENKVRLNLEATASKIMAEQVKVVRDVISQ